MRIRMKSRAAVPGRGVLQPGEVVDVDEGTAVAWLNGGYAEAVATHDVERAVVEPQERERATLPGLGAEPATVVHGVGPATAARLAEADIHLVADMAAAEPAAVAAAAGVSDEKAAGWIEEARSLCESEGESDE